MKLLILSDLHLEFDDSFVIDPSLEYDAVILAGDITNNPSYNVDELNPHEQSEVIYIAGNHEYYGNDISLYNQKFLPKVYYFEENGENVRIICATLWTDFAATGRKTECMAMAKMFMNDYRKIKDGNHNVRPQDILEMHRYDLKFIENVLNERYEGKTVVVTHHGPSMKSVHPKFNSRDDMKFANSFYVSNLDHLVEKADLWVQGHTHCAHDYMIGKCRVVCNPRGYPGEDTGFNPSLVVEV